MHRYVQLHVILRCFGFFGVSGKRGLSGVTKEFEGGVVGSPGRPFLDLALSPDRLSSFLVAGLLMSLRASPTPWRPLLNTEILDSRTPSCPHCFLLLPLTSQQQGRENSQQLRSLASASAITENCASQHAEARVLPWQVVLLTSSSSRGGEGHCLNEGHL